MSEQLDTRFLAARHKYIENQFRQLMHFLYTLEHNQFLIKSLYTKLPEAFLQYILETMVQYNL